MTTAPSFWRNGVVWRRPGSGSIGPTEAIPAAFARGYTLHLFDPKTGKWEAERALVRARGGRSVPWTRVTDPNDLLLLEITAQTWGTSAIAANIEIGNGGTGSTLDPHLMADTLLTFGRVGRGLLITDGWADPIGCWHGFRRWAGSVECFPEVDRALEDVRGCRLHASAFFRLAIAMLATYGTGWKNGRKPVLADYEPTDYRLLFAGDDVDAWSEW